MVYTIFQILKNGYIVFGDPSSLQIVVWNGVHHFSLYQQKGTTFYLVSSHEKYNVFNIIDAYDIAKKIVESDDER